MFHDQVEPLIDMMSRAFPAVRGATDILPAAVTEFTSTLGMLYMFRHLERGGAPRVDDPEIGPRLADLGGKDKTRLQRTFDILPGTVVPDWTADDFRHNNHDERDVVEEDDDLDQPDVEDLDAFEPFGDADDIEDEDEVDEEPDEHDLCTKLAENLVLFSLE